MIELNIRVMIGLEESAAYIELAERFERSYE